MDIDEAVAFADAYLDAEWAHTRAVFTEPDDDAVGELRRAVEAMTHQGAIPVGTGRGPGVPAEEIAARAAAELPEYRRAALFKVAEHAHPLWGRLFAAYTGAGRTYGGGRYARILYIAGTEAGPRVVSVYDADPFPAGQLSWSYLAGVVLDVPGPVVDVRRLTPPDREVDRAEWAS